MKLVHYLDEKWVKDNDLKISGFDISVLRGFGIFDFLRTYNQQPFMCKEHVDRLFRSSKILDIKLPFTKGEITQTILEGIKKNKKECEDFNIRIVVTGGVGVDSVTPGKPSTIVIFSEVQDYPQSYYEKGVKVITSLEKRTLAQAKSLNYLMGVILLQKAKKEKAVEVIYLNEKGKIFEGTTSNFFVVVNKTLITPKDGILVGVTRQVIFKIAKKLGIKIVEKDLTMKDISKFREAFLTASNKEVMPVVQIDKRRIGTGKVGAITKQIMEDFKALTDSYTFS